MGTYSLCHNNNCSHMSTANPAGPRRQGYTDRWVRLNKTRCPPDTFAYPWCGFEGTVANTIEVGGYAAEVASPALWLDDQCEPLALAQGGSTGALQPGETTTQGWTRATLRAFLDSVWSQGVVNVDIWCGCPGRLGLPLPCPTCPWVFEELARWKAKGGGPVSL